MSVDGVEDKSGISLFSRPRKKARVKAQAAAIHNSASDPGKELQRTNQEDGKHELDTVNRGTVVSTSGRDEALTGFRSLGVSEWLDRYFSTAALL